MTETWDTSLAYQNRSVRYPHPYAYQELHDYLEDSGIWHRTIKYGQSIRTREDINRLNLPLERVVKSLIFKDCNGAIIVSIPMNCELNSEKLRRLLGTDFVFVPHRDIPLYGGYEAGTLPPIYHRRRNPITRYRLDERFLIYGTVLTGSGLPDRLIELKVEDIIRLSKPDVHDISDPI